MARTESEIREKVLEAVRAEFSAQQVTLETNLRNLGADDLDLANLMMTVEGELDMHAVIMDDERGRNLETVADFVAYAVKLDAIEDARDRARAQSKTNPAAALEACEAGLKLLPTGLTFHAVKTDALAGLGRFPDAAQNERHVLQLLETRTFDGGRDMPDDLRQSAIEGTRYRVALLEKGKMPTTANKKGCGASVLLMVISAVLVLLAAAGGH